MFLISDDELDKKPPIGDVAKCPRCGRMHKVEYGLKVNEDGSKEESKFLAFIHCPTDESSWLVGINGKEINR